MKTDALRAFRVGITQSNRSMPQATALSKSIGRPTPIRYRGLFAGSMAAVGPSESIACSVSPTLNPPRHSRGNRASPALLHSAREAKSVPP